MLFDDASRATPQLSLGGRLAAADFAKFGVEGAFGLGAEAFEDATGLLALDVFGLFLVLECLGGELFGVFDGDLEVLVLVVVGVFEVFFVEVAEYFEFH